MLDSCGQSLWFCMSGIKTVEVLGVFLNSHTDKSYISVFTLLQMRNFQGIRTYLLHKTKTAMVTS